MGMLRILVWFLIALNNPSSLTILQLMVLLEEEHVEIRNSLLIAPTQLLPHEEITEKITNPT